MRDVSEKLRRLLYLVPFVAKHNDGVPVAHLAEVLGVDPEQITKDLDMLSQVGPPDGDPGEYLLISLEEGRVFVDLPQRLTRPLRLTPAEGCSLLLGLRTLRESGVAPFDDALESAERKLLAALGPGAASAKDLATGTVVADADRAVATRLRELVTAARKHTTMRMRYSSISSHEGAERLVDPYGLVHHRGAWYLVGHCHKRGDTRTFRIDRVAELDSTSATFELPDDFDLEAYRRENLYVPSADAVAVRVLLDPLATARIGANWPLGEVTVNEDGSSDVVIDCEGFEWVTGWVLSFGTHAQISSPETAREAMVDRIRTMRTRLAA